MFARIAVLVLVLTLAWAVVARAGQLSRSAGTWSSPATRSGRSRPSGTAPRGGVWKIQKRNGLRNGVIRSGQLLVLP